MTVFSNEALALVHRRAVEAASVYRAATGVGCIVLDASGRAVDDESAAAGCAACRSLRGRAVGRRAPRSPEEGGFESARENAASDVLSACSELHLHGALQAERFGGSYIYICSIGMLHWVSPLYAGGLPAGAMVGGPVMSIDRDEAISAVQDACPESISEAAVAACVDRIPKAGADRVRALAELLVMAAERASDGDVQPKEDARRRIEQQSRISEEIHSIKRRAASGEPVPSYPIDKERELLFAIRRGDESESRRVLNELLGAVFFSSGHRFDAIRFRGLELLVLLSRAAMEAGAEAEEVLGLNFRYLRRFQDLDSTEDLAYLLDSILGRFMRLAFTLKTVKHATAIKRALKFIREHYASEFSLTEAAEAAGLSSAYFSKVFKAELGESFSEHVNRLRIERAVILLTSTGLSLVEIAGQVGFEDQSYFTKVFKRIIGISPGRYRESGGRHFSEVSEVHESADLSQNS